MTGEYQTLTSYCKMQGKSLSIRNHAFCSYVEAYSEAIARNPDNADVTSAALLTAQAMEGYITRAEIFESELIEKAIKPIINKQSSESFIRSVMSSTIGSFVFSLLLVIVFFLAKDQIKSWLIALQ